MFSTDMLTVAGMSNVRTSCVVTHLLLLLLLPGGLSSTLLLLLRPRLRPELRLCLLLFL